MKVKESYLNTVKELPNNAYNFNKNVEKFLVFKSKKSDKIIKSYFNLALLDTKTRKSKRMRDFLRRSSSKKFYVSKSEVRYGIDKVSITLYSLDREKVSFVKPLYTLNKSLSKINKYFIYHYKEKLYSKSFNDYVFGRENKLNKKHIKYVNRLKTFLTTIKTSYSIRSLKKLSKLHTTKNAKNRSHKRWHVMSARKKLRLLQRIKKISMKKKSLHLYNNTLKLIPFSFTKGKISDLNSVYNFLFLVWLLSGLGYYVNKVNGNFFLEHKEQRIKINSPEETSINTINAKLFNFLYILLINKYKFNTEVIQGKIIKFYDIFNRNYMSKVFKKVLLKENLIINYLHKSSISNMKLLNFLPNLKNILSQIYNKKIYLNIVNLKYPHLNADIMLDSVINKLINKKNRLFKVIKMSLKLGKTPLKSLSFFRNKINSLKMNNYISKIVYNNLNKDRFNINSIRNSNYNLTLVNEEKSMYPESKYKSIMESLKYKWITGMRLQAKGRLTNRYAAARALYKYRSKGTMRNLRNLREVNSLIKNKKSLSTLKNSPSTPLLRGQTIPNITFRKGKGTRRVGSFGVKLWLNSN